MILKTINYWSFPGGLEGSLDVIEAIRLAKDLGYEAIELAIGVEGSLNLNTTQADCHKILAEAEKIGVKLPSVASGTYWGRNLADATAEGRAQAIDDLEKMIQITSWLGATTLLTIPGAVDVFFLPEREALPYEHVIQYAKEGLGKVLPLAEKCGVRLGIENVWNRIFMSPLELAQFIDSFDSKFIGSYFDVGNVLPFGYPEDWIRTLGSRIVGVHFKDYRRAVGTADGFVDLLELDVNWPAVIQALAEIGYEGHAAAEMIPGYKHFPMIRVENTSRAMDAILGK